MHPIPLLGAKCADCKATESYGRLWKAIQAADSATSLRFDNATKPGRVFNVEVARNVSIRCVPRARQPPATPNASHRLRGRVVAVSWPCLGPPAAPSPRQSAR